MTWGEAFTWGTWVHTIVGGAHFVSALIALVLGPIVLFRAKGSAFHRSAGYVFVLAMLTVNITALTLYELSGRPNLFHFFAILSLTSLLPGFWALQRAVRLKSDKLLALHAKLMMWSYFGLAAAGVAQIGMRILPEITGDIGKSMLYLMGSLLTASFVCNFVFGYASKRLAQQYSFEETHTG